MSKQPMLSVVGVGVVAAALCLSVLFPTGLYAQVTGATLKGVVTDAQHEAVPNAQVTVTNMATNVAHTTTTNGSGAYAVANLNPGNYQVAAVSRGFSKSVVALTLTVGALQTQNFSLAVGQTQQTVQVTAAAPQINLSSSTLSSVVQRQTIEQLPLNGRDWAALATLQPGVAQVRTQEVVTQPGGDLRGLGMQMTVDGNRPTQNVYRLDGIIVNDYSNAGPGNVLGQNLGVDAVQEFSVLTTDYNAQYGFTSGGVINAITKSGTNSFHGSAYEFLRNSALDAANYFENAAGLKKGQFRRNQFGVSGGGPILRNKWFIFANYEGLRQAQALPLTAQVLSANARKGILNNPDGTVEAPLLGPCPYANMTNLAPGQAAVCVDNTEAKYINGLSPLPNAGLVSPGNVGHYVLDGNQPVSDNFFTFRTDLDISNSDTFHVSYYQDHSSWEKPDTLGNVITGFLVPHEAISAEETHVFTPNFINTVRVGYNRSDLESPGIQALNPVATDKSLGITDASGASLGLNAPSLSALAGGGGATGVSGFGGFAPDGGFFQWTGLSQGYDDASYILGSHSLTFGGMILRDHDNMINSSGNGSVSYASISNLLQNIPAHVRMPTVAPFTPGNTIHHYRDWVYSGYLNDDWRVRSNLTLNLGLRYEMATIPTETNDKVLSLNNIWSNPSGCGYTNGAPAGCTANFRNAVFASNPTTKNFEPRVGFSWDPFSNGKTAVRGGFALFDVLPMPFMIGLNPLQTAPAGVEVDLSQPGQGTFPTGFAAVANNPNINTSANAAKRWAYIQASPKRNYVSQWNFNIQRQLSSHTALTLGYAGSRTFHNVFQTDTLNTVFPYKTSAGYLFPNPWGAGCLPGPPDCTQTDTALGLPTSFNANPTGIVPGLLINPYTALIQSEYWISKAWYEALQVKLNHRMSDSFSFQASFTWQKSLDTSSGSFAGDNFAADLTPTIPWWDSALTKGPSDFNVPRTLNVNALWNLPGNALRGPAAAVAKGWQFGTIITLSDGVPFWPLDGVEGDPMGQLNGEPLAIPHLASGCTAQSAIQPGNVQYVKPDCFEPMVAPSQSFYNASCIKTGNPAAGAVAYPYPTCMNLLGDEGRNLFGGPGDFEVDMSFMKNFAIPSVSEAFHAQFRADFFNILNHTNFQVPVDNLEALDQNGVPVPGFGLIDSTLNPNREIQFALKLIW